MAWRGRGQGALEKGVTWEQGWSVQPLRTLKSSVLMAEVGQALDSGRHGTGDSYLPVVLWALPRWHCGWKFGLVEGRRC